MSHITREQLSAYLDDALGEQESARVELALRESEPLRQSLRQAMQERDRGDHSLGAIWRRERLTCPTREHLGSYVLDVLDDGQRDYLTFHLEQICCPYCGANLADLRAQQAEAAPKANNPGVFQAGTSARRSARSGAANRCQSTSAATEPTAVTSARTTLPRVGEPARRGGRERRSEGAIAATAR